MNRRHFLRRGAVVAFLSPGLGGCLSNEDSTDTSETETAGPQTLRTAAGTPSDPVSNTVTSEVSGLSVEDVRVIESDPGTFQVAAEIRNMVVQSVADEVSLYQYNKTFTVYDSDGTEISTETRAEVGADGRSLETDETGTVLFTATVPADAEVARYEIVINCNLQDYQADSTLC